MPLVLGLSASYDHVVRADDTAAALGSGDVPVLGTPRLLAWLEAATVQALATRLEPDSTTVGTRVELDHRAASPVGVIVTCEAELLTVDGPALVFAVRARHERREVAAGRITRMVVGRERFLARLDQSPRR